MDKRRGFYEKMEVFVLLRKYMDKYNLNGTRIFSADKSKNPLSKNIKTLHLTGKPAALYNTGSVAITDCATWTDCVTCSVVEAAGVSQSIS